MCLISSGQLIGWPLWRRTSAAASSALSLDGAAGVRARGAGSRAGVGEAGGLVGFFFLALGAGSDEVRVFLAVMVSLRGRQLALGDARVRPQYQGRRTTSTAPAVPGNSRQNLPDFRYATTAMVTAQQPDIAWSRAGVCANAVAAHSSPAPLPRSTPDAAPVPVDRGRGVRGT